MGSRSRQDCFGGYRNGCPILRVKYRFGIYKAKSVGRGDADDGKCDCIGELKQIEEVTKKSWPLPQWTARIRRRQSFARTAIS